MTSSVRAARARRPASAERVIRRYGNRKLYDARAGRHVTLDDVAALVAAGEEVRVLDRATGDDLTAVTLAQVVLDGIKARTSSIPGQVLARLIRYGVGGRGTRPDWSPQHAAARARTEAERIVAGLLGRGRLTLEEGLALRQEIAGTVQRMVAEAQHGLESRVRGLLERSEKEGGVNPSLRTLRERLMTLEGTLDAPAGTARGRRPRSPSTARRKR
jgi:polyhydroxyalkanoate synthesis repressor PhaR